MNFVDRDNAEGLLALAIEANSGLVPRPLDEQVEESFASNSSTAWLAPWYAALREEVGICLRCVSPPALTKSRLYQARAKSGDDTLKCLSIVSSPRAKDELWIVRRVKDD